MIIGMPRDVRNDSRGCRVFKQVKYKIDYKQFNAKL